MAGRGRATTPARPPPATRGAAAAPSAPPARPPAPSAPPPRPPAPFPFRPAGPAGSEPCPAEPATASVLPDTAVAAARPSGRWPASTILVGQRRQPRPSRHEHETGSRLGASGGGLPALQAAGQSPAAERSPSLQSVRSHVTSGSY